ncbi:LRR domain containing protein, partial [Trema orientale]
GTTLIEVIFLDLSKIPKDICLRSNVFEDLYNLRLLKVTSGSNYSSNCNSKSVNVPQGLGYLPDSLIYLEWSHCPLKSLPSNFEPLNLVKLYMRGSKLKDLSNGIVHLGNLKDIDVSFSKELIRLPDLSQALKLERLNILGCRSLRQLPKLPRNIEDLDLNACTRLESLPSNVVKVKYLDMSKISYYKRLKSLPEISEVMEHLEGLSIEGTRIQELSPSNQNLIVLCALNSRIRENLKFDTLSHLSNCSKLGCFPCVLLGLNLTYISLSYCNIQEIPDWFGLLSSLTNIDLSGNSFVRIPSSIIHLDKLCCLYVSGCKNLQHLPELPRSILCVDAGECTSLQTVDTLKGLPYGIGNLEDHEFVIGFSFHNCVVLEQSAGANILNYFLSLVYNQMNISSWKKYAGVPTCYPGDEIPEWFSNQWEGSTATVTLPPNWLNNNFSGFATCVVLEFGDSFDLKNKLNISTTLFNINYGEEYYDSTMSFESYVFADLDSKGIILSSDHVCMWCNYDPNIKLFLMNLDLVEASFDYFVNVDSEKNVKVKRCGLRMLYFQEAGEEYPVSQYAMVAKDICPDLTLSIVSHSDEVSILECHDCSDMELQRTGNNRYSEHSTIANTLCRDSFLSTDPYSEAIIPDRNDCSSNSNTDGYTGCLVSNLLEEPHVITNQPEPSEIAPINSDAAESHIQRIKRFNICGCLPFLSVIIGNF